MHATNNLYRDTAALVRSAGGVLFPSFYGAPLNTAAVDQVAVDVVPSPDRGPFVVTGISGLPFTTITQPGPGFRIDRISIRAGGNDLQYEPFLANSFDRFSVDFGLTFPYPILIPPGGSCYIRNFVTGVTGETVDSPEIILNGFHTDARGARAVARNGQPWVVPFVNNHGDTGQQDIQTERQMISDVVEMGYFSVNYQSRPGPGLASNLLLNARIRGVEIMQGNRQFAQTGVGEYLGTTGAQLLAKCQAGDAFTLRTVANTPLDPESAFMGNLFTRRIYRQPNLQCN